MVITNTEQITKMQGKGMAKKYQVIQSFTFCSKIKFTASEHQDSDSKYTKQKFSPSENLRKKRIER